MQYVARCVQVAAEIGLADALGDEPMPWRRSRRHGRAGEHSNECCAFSRRMGLFHVDDGRCGHMNVTADAHDHPARCGTCADDRSAGEPGAPRWSGTLNPDGRGAMSARASGVCGPTTRAPRRGRISTRRWKHGPRHDRAIRAPTIQRLYTLVDVGGGRGHSQSAILDDASATRAECCRPSARRQPPPG